MCRVCGVRHNSLEDAQGGSPTQQLQDVVSDTTTTGNASMPFSLSLRSPGKVSPLRGRTMKEYEEQLGNLKKENFSLKLRIYFLEEKMGQKYDKEDKDGLYKTNIELKVEAEALKRELCDKQDLLRQASTALMGLEQQYQDKVAQLKSVHDQEKDDLGLKIKELQKEVDEYAERVRDGGGQLGELTQLCGLAFSTGDELDIPSSLASSQDSMSLPAEFSKAGNSFISPSPMQGLFSMSTSQGPSVLPTNVNSLSQQKLPESTINNKVNKNDTDNQQKVTDLQEKIAELEERVNELEEELAVKEQANTALQGDLANLEKELEDKLEKIGELEAEVSEKDMKIDDVMQELETRHMEIQTKDDEIQTLTQDLINAEPEIEVKVQEIVERDRIIEEKIEQIEQQNKILVEIQITLDEKQRQLADQEQKLSESNEKIKSLTQQYDKSLEMIKACVEEVETRDKDIASLKKELKRKEKKIRDLVAELKEAIDMLNKAKWEAETSGGEDGVKEMAEEENERLWAELESRKNEVLALRSDHRNALTEAEERIKALQEKLDEKVKALDGEKDKRTKEDEEREARLLEQAQQIARLETQLEALNGDLSNREGQLRSNEDVVKELRDELASTKDQLKERKTELDSLQDELRKKNSDMQDLVNHELWERNKEVEKLQEKLSALSANRQQQLESLENKLEMKNNEVQSLRIQLGIEAKDAVIENSKTPSSNVSDVHVTQTPVTIDQTKNGTHFTVIANSGGTDVVNVSRPLHLTVTDDNSASVQMLYSEMSKIRSEAQALRLERGILNDKLSGLQKMYEHVSQTTDLTKAGELHSQITDVKKQLEESKVESLQKEHKHGEVINDFQSQIQTLRNELNNAKKKINKQLTEVSFRKYHEALKRHKQEIANLRKRLADSHNTCDVLRSRLEELADFMERILEMDEKGLINLSQLSNNQLSLLHKTLNESRALSFSLSQSLMIGMESTDHVDDNFLSTSVNSVSNLSLHQDDSLSETHDSLAISTHQVTASFADESMLPPDDKAHDLAVQALASQLNSQIEIKTREIDAIADKVVALSEQLATRTSQVEQQSIVIDELRGQVSQLQEEVRHKELQLQVSGTDQDHISIQRNHSSWQSSFNPLVASSQSTLHAVSPQATIHSHDSSSQDMHCKSLSSCSDTLPPPPLHLLQDSECEILHHDGGEIEICQASDRSSFSAIKSAYSTDPAIKANSGHPGYFQQLATPSDRSRQDRQYRSWGETTNMTGSCIVPEHPWAAVSPSESEAWSEPDRNVSLARIGLDACTLVQDRALSRSRQQRASTAIITSESDADAAHEDTTTCTLNPASVSGKTNKRRSDIAELRRVTAKLREVEQLNETLRAELNIYQTLSQQMASQDLGRPKTSDKSVETHKGETADASVGAEVASVPVPLPPPQQMSIPAPLLDEIRALRLKLEEAISNNDHLRDQLEAALTAHPQDEARFHHLTAALQTTQEELKDARTRLQGSQEKIRENEEQYSHLHIKLQEAEIQKSQSKEQLEAVQKEVALVNIDLRNAQQLIQDKEVFIQKLDIQMQEKENVLRDYTEKVKQLENNISQNPNTDKRVTELEAALHSLEARLLEMNKERLSLVGEKASLQAKLASVSTHARLLQDSHGEDEAAEQSSLQISISSLQNEIVLLENENRELKEKLHNVQYKSNQVTTETNVATCQTDTEDNVRLKNAYTSLQHVLEDLQCHCSQQEKEINRLKEKHNITESDQKTFVKQLKAQLDSERRLTANLKLQLDTIHSNGSLPISIIEDPVVPPVSDLASPESVTSIEFFRPTSHDLSDLRNRRQASLGPISSLEKEKVHERRASSASRRRDSSRRRNTHWSEDKENVFTTTTTTVIKKQNRHYNDVPYTEQTAISTRRLDDEHDGETTSGESPDLGIGSDYPFSSLERGTRGIRSVVQTAQDLPPSSLCSEPSHSTLTVENHRLRQERNNLSEKLKSTEDTLKDTLEKLVYSNKRKENVERAICKQLTKTHNVLKKSKSTLKQPNSLPN